MRIALRSTLILAALGAASSASAAPKDPSGTWLTEDGRAKVRIDRCGPGGAQVCGKVVWLKSPNGPGGVPRTDLKNPDPAKRTRPVIGLRLLDGLKPEDSKFAGEIYNADEGKMYSVSLERESEAELTISGCLLKVLCGSQTWNRVPDINQQAAVAPSDTHSAGRAAKPAAKTGTASGSMPAANAAAQPEAAPASDPED